LQRPSLDDAKVKVNGWCPREPGEVPVMKGRNQVAAPAAKVEFNIINMTKLPGHPDSGGHEPGDGRPGRGHGSRRGRWKLDDLVREGRR
jgi:hypothetical protein